MSFDKVYKPSGLYNTMSGTIIFVLMLYGPNQLFSYVRTIFCLPVLKQYLSADNVSCSITEHDDSDESRTSNPFILSLPTEPLRTTVSSVFGVWALLRIK